MTDGLEIVSSGLLNTFVRGDRGVPGRARQILAILVGDVLTLAVLEALGQAEVYDVDVVAGGLGASDQKIVRFDVSVDDALVVHLLNSANHL